METKEIKRHIYWFEFFTDIYSDLYEVSGESEEHQEDLWKVYYRYLDKHDLDRKLNKAIRCEYSPYSVDFYLEKLNKLLKNEKLTQ